MDFRILGATGLRVSEIGLGTSKRLVEHASKAEGEKIIRSALDLGINFIDTARHYGDGEAEVRIGEGLRGRREEAIIATKGGTFPYTMSGYGSRSFTSKALKASLEKSLQALGTDYVDIYQLHMGGASQITAGSEALEALMELKNEGKCRFTGASVDGRNMHQYANLDFFDTLQVSYNFADHYPEDSGFFAKAREKNIGIIIKEPLCVAQYYRPSAEPSWVYDLWQKVRKFDFLMNDYQDRIVEIALRFVLANPDVHTAIQATSNIEHLESNAAVSDGQPIDPKLYKKIMDKYRLIIG